MDAYEFAKKVYEANKNYVESNFSQKEKEIFFSLRDEFNRKFSRKEKREAAAKLGLSPCSPLA